MKIKNIFIKTMIVIIVGMISLNADSVSPTSKKVASNTPVSISLRYTIDDPSTPPDICTATSSPLGTFSVPGIQAPIGTDNRVLTARFSGGRGYVSTNIRVPYSVLKKAQNLGKNKIIYSRTFGNYVGNCFPNPQPVNMTINVTSQMAIGLNVKRIKLYFDNKRPITTVDQFTKLNLYAKVDFIGSGSFKAYWEVDGRKVSNIIKHISYAHNEVFKYPKIPTLPTFNEGTHIVKFIITKPNMEIVFPKAVYYVNATINGKLRNIKLLSPINGRYYTNEEPKLFVWQKNLRDKIFLLEFFDSINNKPIFSAITKDSKYKLSNKVIESMFKKGETYYWQVKGYDEAGNNTSISEKREVKL